MRVTYSVLFEDECNLDSQKNKRKLFSGNMKRTSSSEVPWGQFAKDIKGWVENRIFIVVAGQLASNHRHM
jgi:hypothetical protein